MILLKQSTAVTIPFGPFLDDADGKTAETGLSIATADVRISKNGGANAAKNSTTATSHNELGYYNIHLSATDTNTLGALKVMVSKEGALPVWADFMVVTPMIYDVMCGAGNLTGVKLDPVQGAITWAQQKIIANVANQGALHVENTHANGFGNINKGNIGQGNQGVQIGQGNISTAEIGMGQYNNGYTGQLNTTIFGSGGKNVEGFDPAILDSIKGVGWTNQTLKAIYDAIGSGGSSITAQDVWEYAARTLTAVPSGVALEATLTALNTLITAIKGKTDTIPANPASVGSAMTLADGAITAAKLGTGAITADKIAASAITDAKIATDAISAAKVKADAVTKIQNGLAKTSELPVIPSDYAKETNATANTTTITTAITNKAVTPPTDISTLAKSSELTGLAKTTDLTGLAKTTDLSTVAKSSELTTLATEANATTNTSDILEAIEEIAISSSGGATPKQVWEYADRTLTESPIDISDLAEKDDIPTVVEIQSGLAKTTDLADIAKKADVPTVAQNQSGIAKSNEIPTVVAIQSGLAKSSELTGLAKTTDLSGLAKTTDLNSVAKSSELTGLAKETNATSNKEAIVTAIVNKPVTPATDISTLAKSSELTSLAKETNATANKDAVILAIGAKPVTPATDISGLATKEDLEDTKEEIIEAIDDKPVTPAVDISALAKQNTVLGIKEQTDRIRFDSDGLVESSAQVNVDSMGLATERSIQKVLGKINSGIITIISDVENGEIRKRRGDDWSITLPIGVGNSVVQFAIKEFVHLQDSASVLFVSSDGGLEYLNGSEGVSSLGKITSYDEEMNISVSSAATKELPIGEFLYGVQTINSSTGVSENYSGKFIIYGDIVRRVS